MGNDQRAEAPAAEGRPNPGSAKRRALLSEINLRQHRQAELIARLAAAVERMAENQRQTADQLKYQTDKTAEVFRHAIELVREHSQKRESLEAQLREYEKSGAAMYWKNQAEQWETKSEAAVRLAARKISEARAEKRSAQMQVLYAAAIILALGWQLFFGG